jgi:hypothetical protein
MYTFFRVTWSIPISRALIVNACSQAFSGNIDGSTGNDAASGRDGNVTVPTLATATIAVRASRIQVAEILTQSAEYWTPAVGYRTGAPSATDRVGDVSHTNHD